MIIVNQDFYLWGRQTSHDFDEEFQTFLSMVNSPALTTRIIGEGHPKPVISGATHTKLNDWEATSDDPVLVQEYFLTPTENGYFEVEGKKVHWEVNGDSYTVTDYEGYQITVCKTTGLISELLNEEETNLVVESLIARKNILELLEGAGWKRLEAMEYTNALKRAAVHRMLDRIKDRPKALLVKGVRESEEAYLDAIHNLKFSHRE